MACWIARVRVALVIAWIFGLPTLVAAQTTLLVRVGEPSCTLDHAIEDALRDQLGGGVRSIELSLDELALAAGCELDAAASEACVRTIAAAAGATLVALERVTRVGSEWQVQIDVRRADGTHLSTLRAGCEDEASCSEGLRASATDGRDASREVREEDRTSDLLPRHVAAGARDLTATTDAPIPDPEPPTRRASLGVFPLVIFGGAALLGLGSIVAGGIAAQSSHDAAALGVLRSEEQVDHERALENEANIALAVGIVLASCGAGLAAVGGALTAMHTGPSLQVGLGPRGLTVRF